MGANAYAYKPQLDSTIDSVETDSRRKRRRSVKTFGNARKLVYCVIPLALLLIYVGGTAGLTAQTYKLAAEQRVHNTLIEENNDLRSRVAQLESVDRLQAVARQLHMAEPNKVAFIASPTAAKPVDRKLAFLARIAGVTRWLGVR